MATVTYQACDECSDRGPRLIEIDGHIYCSRDCYLRACKRTFDLRWLQLLKSDENEETMTKTKRILLTKIA